MENIKYKPAFLFLLICFLFAGNMPAMAYEDKFQNAINAFQESPFSTSNINNPQQVPPMPDGEGDPPAGGLERDNPVGSGLELLLGMSIAYGWFLFNKRKKEVCK